MTDSEELKILEKAFFKASVQGLSLFRLSRMQIVKEFYNGTFYWIIFNHSFAKAFWGENKTFCGCDTTIIGEHCAECLVEYTWQYHLQQMVLEENPLSYLERFL